MRANRLALTASIALAAALTASGAAHAGTYQVKACRDASDGAADAFTATNTNPATITTSAQCPPVPGEPFSGLLVAATLATPNTPSGASGGWTLAAPAGTTLQQLTARRYIGKRDRDWKVAVRKADGTTLETCDFDPILQLGCTVGSSTPTDPDNTTIYANLATPSVTFAISCQAGAATCSNGTSQRQAWIALYGATATIQDPAPPTLGTLTGSLLGPGATDGWHRGVEQATIPANDASGVKSTSLLIDGQPVANAPQTCTYTRMQPCPGSVAPTLALDLAQIADGTHELRAAATDAADQQQLSAPITLRVDQHAPTPPIGLTATANGSDTYRLDWQNPEQGSAAPIVAAHYAVCRSAQPADCPTGEVIAGNAITRIRAVHMPPGDRYDIHVWLQDAAANSDPGRAATVTVDTTQPNEPQDAIKRGPETLPGGKTTRSPKLRPKRAVRHGALLTISGTIAPNATGTVSATLARNRTGKRLLTADTSAKHGRWTLRIRLTHSQRRNPPRYLTLRYAGDKRHTQAKLLRHLVTKRSAKHTPPTKSTIAEFDFETVKHSRAA